MKWSRIGVHQDAFSTRSMLLRGWCSTLFSPSPALSLACYGRSRCLVLKSHSSCSAKWRMSLWQWIHRRQRSQTRQLPSRTLSLGPLCPSSLLKRPRPPCASRLPLPCGPPLPSAAAPRPPVFERPAVDLPRPIRRLRGPGLRLATPGSESGAGCAPSGTGCVSTCAEGWTRS